MLNALLLLALPAFGEVPEAIRAVNNSVSAAYQSMRLDYREPSDGAIKAKYYDTERGTLTGGGVSVAVSVLRDVGRVRTVYLAAFFSRANGEVPYDGHAYVGPGGSIIVPLKDTSRADIRDWGLRLGKAYAWGERRSFTPYLAYGYHSWDRRVGSGSGGYYEYYSHHALQAGGRAQWAAGRWVLTLDGRFGATLEPKIRVPNYHLNERLGRAPAADVEAEADRVLARRLHAFLALRYGHFGYFQSRVENGFLEPISVTDTLTWLAGLRLSL